MKVYTEVGTKRVFAGALEWPGWCRGGRDEASALQSLLDYGPRYQRVVRGMDGAFKIPAKASALEVAERLEGDATTDFGAPAIAPAADVRTLDAAGLTRLLTILRACWAAFDRATMAAEGTQLLTGPRGGGRDLDAMIAHVSGAEAGYVRRIAGRAPTSEGDDPREEMVQIRAVVLEALERAVADGLPEKGPKGGRIWTPRYFVRRTAWHALDHAWELEDRSTG